MHAGASLDASRCTAFLDEVDKEGKVHEMISPLATDKESQNKFKQLHGELCA
jgi:hypothetical protein